MSSALIIIDVQNDYFPGGKMELVDMEAAAQNCSRLLQASRSHGLPVFHVQHLSTREGAGFFIPGTPGCEIHPSVRPENGEPVITKHFPNAFRDTPLEEQLRASGTDELVICGAMSHMCIDTTTRAAFDLGFKCRLISDACATRDLKFGERTIPAADVHAAFMAALGTPFAEIDTTRAYLETNTPA